MKKGLTAALAVLAVFLFFLASPAFAGLNEVDAQKSAQVFAGTTLSYCSGSFNFERWGKGEFMEPVYGSFTFVPESKMITYLEVYGEVVVDETMEPWKGLPLNKKGEARYYSIWLTCYDDNDNNLQAYGDFYKEIMRAKDVIVIMLQPDSQRITIPFQVPKGVEKRNLRMAVDQGDGNKRDIDYCEPSWEWKYCPESGFTFWGNPLKIMPYEIKDVSNGIVYATGTINPLAQNPVTQDPVTPITLQFLGGVREVRFDTADYAWEYLTNQGMDGEVEQCVEDSPVYEQMPMSTVEQMLMMGDGRTLYKFRGSAPANADSPMGPLDFSVLAWSNGGSLEFPSVALYAYLDSNYSTPFTKLSPDGMVAPSKTASVGWSIPSNEPGSISISAAKDGILTIPAGQTLYFDLRVDILGFEAGVGKCAFVATTMEGLGETVLYTPEGCTEIPTPPTTTPPIPDLAGFTFTAAGAGVDINVVETIKMLAPEEASGGSGSAHGPAVSSTKQPACETEIVPAKVYFMDLRGGALTVSVSEMDGEVEIRQWQEKGEMPVIAFGETDNWGWGFASTQSGYGIVVVTVTGVSRNSDGFYISFGRSPYAPPRDNGGGGKG